ncbi:MAG TPA: hypothetical protein VEJ18_05165, partial [Planctomycetota bacterium]|nr:hypothetical protein [Planctomycetota bacterium]
KLQAVSLQLSAEQAFRAGPSTKRAGNLTRFGLGRDAAVSPDSTVRTRGRSGLPPFSGAAYGFRPEARPGGSPLPITDH